MIDISSKTLPTKEYGTYMCHGSSPPPPPPPSPILEWELKISDQNNWEGGLSKKLNLGGGAKFKGEPKILGGPMNPNDVMVVALKVFFYVDSI